MFKCKGEPNYRSEKLEKREEWRKRGKQGIIGNWRSFHTKSISTGPLKIC